MAAPATDFDSPWKEALEYYLSNFLALVAPRLYEQIDWSHPPVFLDKELQAITRDASSRRRYADKLVRLRHKDQHPVWILIHIEIQGGVMSMAGLALFGERMFQYFYRISDHQPKTLIAPDGTHQKIELISLGVLTASASTGTHLVYFQGGLDVCRVKFSFPVVHLASWLARWDELEQRAAHNPFAVVVMAQLQAQQTRKNGTQRLVSKTQIVRLMYRYKYSEQDVLQLFRIIDWVMALPAELEPAFEQAMITIEQEHKMSFVTSIERLGEKRGWEKGHLEGEASLLQRLLMRKFGSLPQNLQQRIQTATPEQLETWSLNILDAQTLDDVFAG